MQEFSDESDDVDYILTEEEMFVNSLPAANNDELKVNDIESAKETNERKVYRHEQFQKMAFQFGFSSSHEFALHVQDTTKEERMKLLSRFYGTSSASDVGDKTKLKGKRKCEKKPGVQDASLKNDTKMNALVQPLQPSAQTRKLTRRKHRKALKFLEDSPPSPKKICPNGSETQDSDDPFISIKQAISSSSSTCAHGGINSSEIETDSQTNNNTCTFQSPCTTNDQTTGLKKVIPSRLHPMCPENDSKQTIEASIKLKPEDNLNNNEDDVSSSPIKSLPINKTTHYLDKSSETYQLLSSNKDQIPKDAESKVKKVTSSSFNIDELFGL